MAGVRETYHAALQHDLVALDGEEHLVGVVRRRTPWFTQVDDNRPELGPPEDLLEEAKTRTEELSDRGLDDAAAHNRAWADVDFEARYRDYLADSDEAQAALADLADRVRDGETVVLVCFEGEEKRCHRRLLADLLSERV